MKRQLLIYIVSFLIFFVLISLARGWFSTVFLAFWIGGLIGAILPDVDHLIYIYFLKPHELTSQRATRMLSRGEVWSTLNLLATTRSERTNLIFHNAAFQIIFLIFSFFVLSSSGSFLGRGIVLSFLLHLLVDQYIDFQQVGSIGHWTKSLELKLDHKQSVFYWLAVGLILVFYGFVL